MELNISTAPLWSYGIAAISYLAFTLHLLRWRHENLRDPVDMAVIFALMTTSVWAAAGFLLALKTVPQFVLAHNAFDSLRYGAWYGFSILLLRTATVHNSSINPVKPVNTSGRKEKMAPNPARKIPGPECWFTQSITPRRSMVARRSCSS